MAGTAGTVVAGRGADVWADVSRGDGVASDGVAPDDVASDGAASDDAASDDGAAEVSSVRVVPVVGSADGVVGVDSGGAVDGAGGGVPGPVVVPRSVVPPLVVPAAGPSGRTLR